MLLTIGDTRRADGVVGSQLLMGWSWMKDDTWRKEEKRRRELAEEIDLVSGRYERAVEHARWWDRHTARPRHADLVWEDRPDRDHIKPSDKRSRC